MCGGCCGDPGWHRHDRADPRCVEGPRLEEYGLPEPNTRREGLEEERGHRERRPWPLDPRRKELP